MTTLKDVAKLAGVSPSTVSRTLTGAANVSDKVRERVLAAIEELGYETNTLAKSLRQKRSNTLALLIPNIRNPFYPIATKGVVAAAKAQGFTVILSDTDDNPEQEIATINRLKNHWVDGFIIATTSESKHEHLLELHENKIPLVLLIRKIDREIPTILPDDFRGGYLGTKYLIEKGHQRIAFICGNLHLSFNRNRRLGYLKALAEVGLGEDSRIMVDTVFGYEEGYQAMAGLLRDKAQFTAVLCTSDLLAIGAMRALYDGGYKIPQDISVMGFDNLDVSSMIIPALTTVSQPAYEMGEMAANRVIELINGQTWKSPLYTMDVAIIERETVAAIQG